MGVPSQGVSGGIEIMGVPSQGVSGGIEIRGVPPRLHPFCHHPVCVCTVCVCDSERERERISVRRITVGWVNHSEPELILRSISLCTFISLSV